MVKMSSFEMISPPPSSDTSAPGEESSEFIVLPNSPFPVVNSIHTPACSMNGFQMSVMSASSDLTSEELNYWLKELVCGNTALKEALQRSNRMMHEQVSTVTAWREQMMQTNNKHVAMLEEAKKTIQKLQAENELVKKSLSTENGSSAESCTQCPMLENKVLALQEEVSALGLAKTALTGELEKQQNLQQHLEQSMKNISHNLGSLQSSSETLESEKRELTALNNELITQLANLSVAKKGRDEATVFCDDEIGYAIVFPPDGTQDKEFDGDGLKGALLQLHEERLKVSELTQALAEERAEVACLKKLLEEKTQQVEILGAKTVVQSTELVTCEGGKLPAQAYPHQSTDNFNLHQGTEPPHPELLLAVSYAQKYKDRCENLQFHVEQYQEKLQQLQASDGTIIDQLKQEVKNLQENLREEKKNLMESNRNLEKMTQDYNTLLELLKSQADEQKAKNAEKDDENGRQHRLHIEQLDCLTARLMNTQQQLEAEEQKVNLLKKKLDSIEQDTETIPILKAQVELYKSDFENERIACESAKSEVEKLKKEVFSLQHEHAEGQNQDFATVLKKRGLKGYVGTSNPKQKFKSKSQAESKYEDQSLPKENMQCPCCNLQFTNLRELTKHIDQCLK